MFLMKSFYFMITLITAPLRVIAQDVTVQTCTSGSECDAVVAGTGKSTATINCQDEKTKCSAIVL